MSAHREDDVCPIVKNRRRGDLPDETTLYFFRFQHQDNLDAHIHDGNTIPRSSFKTDTYNFWVADNSDFVPSNISRGPGDAVPTAPDD